MLCCRAPALPPAPCARAQLRADACILTTGRRTIAPLLRIVPPLLHGSSSSYHRVLSQAPGSSLQLAGARARFLIRHVLPTGLSTVWVVLCVLVRFPLATRAWALPVLVALSRSAEQNRQRQRPHRTPAQLMGRLRRLLLLWFPGRHCRFVGDAGYGTHAVARFAHRHRARLTLVSKFHPDANLYDPPPAYAGLGRPRGPGRWQAKPKAAVARSRRPRLQVGWYGGGTRRVEAVTGTGPWYQAGRGRGPVRGVFVPDRDGTQRDASFFPTEPTLPPKAVMGSSPARWNSETTCQELRAYLGLETTRGWCAQTVLRAAPCLFGLYTVGALLYEQLPAAAQEAGRVDWLGKAEGTFADARTAGRRWWGAHWVLAQGDHAPAFAKLPEPLREVLLDALAPAA